MASQILRVSLIGTQPGGEVWSTNPCWELNGSTGETVSQAQALTVATAINLVTIPTALLSCMGTQTRLTATRVEARQLAGLLEAQAEAARATAVVGTGPNIHPHGTALVCSLRTPAVGPSGRGRMYWPATGQALDNTDYRIAASNVTSLLTGFKTLLSGIEGAIRVTFPEANLTVWSRKVPRFADVTSLQVGNIPDSQRRRRDTLSEGYQGTTYP